MSIHVPKTAGTTFGHYLKSQFGDQMIFCYPCVRCRALLYAAHRRDILEQQGDISCGHTGDISQVVRYIVEHDIQWIHGHLRAGLFEDYFDVKYVVWLRSPVERAVSEYEFLLRNPMIGFPEVRELLNEGRFEDFHKRIGNHQSKFLSSLRLEALEFLGLTETFEEDLRRFEALFRLEHKPIIAYNVNPRKGGGERYEIDARTRALIESANENDLKIYRDAERLLAKRLC